MDHGTKALGGASRFYANATGSSLSPGAVQSQDRTILEALVGSCPFLCAAYTAMAADGGDRGLDPIRFGRAGDLQAEAGDPVWKGLLDLQVQDHGDAEGFR